MGDDPGDALRYVANFLAHYLNDRGHMASVERLDPPGPDLEPALRLRAGETVDLFEFAYGARLTREYRELFLGLKLARLFHAFLPILAGLLRRRRAPSGARSQRTADREAHKRRRFAAYFLTLYLGLILTLLVSVHAIVSAHTWGWAAVAVIVALLGLGARSALADATDKFTPAIFYLREAYKRAEITLGLRARLKKLERLGYDRITLLAHSFGSVVAMDARSGWDPPLETLVTVGCPFVFLDRYGLYRDLPFRTRAAGLKVNRWVNIHHVNDVMGTVLDSRAVENRRIETELPDLPARETEAHNAYRSDAAVCMATLGEILELA